MAWHQFNIVRLIQNIHQECFDVLRYAPFPNNLLVTRCKNHLRLEVYTNVHNDSSSMESPIVFLSKDRYCEGFHLGQWLSLAFSTFLLEGLSICDTHLTMSHCDWTGYPEKQTWLYVKLKSDQITAYQNEPRCSFKGGLRAMLQWFYCIFPLNPRNSWSHGLVTKSWCSSRKESWNVINPEYK